MKFHILFIFLLIHILPTPIYTATDIILLNCGGGSTILNDTDHRSWVGDDHLFLPTNATAISFIASNPSILSVPYETARIFRSRFTYTFPLSKGQKFLRLHFYPSIYSHYDTSKYSFSVVANDITVLTKFSPFIYSQNSSQPYFMKEFVINIIGDNNNDELVLTFLPEPRTFAFVNGIEIVPIPDKLYFRGKDVLLKYVDADNSQVFYLDFNSAFENLYRLNVGGNRVDIGDDSSMFRGWSPDDDYLTGSEDMTESIEDVEVKYTVGTPPYSAPKIVYTTARVTANNSISLNWEFPVDSGFNYLLRLHFCEFTPGVTKSRQRIFMIGINNIRAEFKADVLQWVGTRLTPTFRDYIIFVPNYDGRSRKTLRLSLFPDFGSDPNYRNAFLNGLEIFKLNVSHGILGVPNDELMVPNTQAVKPVQEKSRGSSLVVYASIGSVIGFLAVVGVLSFFIYRKVKKKKKPSNDGSVTKSSWLPLSDTSVSATSSGAKVPRPSNLCRYFSLAEIKTATSSLDRSFIIGKGGFGYVYRGVIDNGKTTVAIKRLNPSSNQGFREFLTEIQMLSKLRHLHLVSLIGYCDDDGEMILVYDYMAHGSLSHYLYNSESSTLSWTQRLKICLGAAKGLHYLHTGTENAIIHRDVKSTNILLDENLVAKISDFGLSRMGDGNDSFTHISTNIKGTFGYLDPKYLSTHQLTRKSDVYAFGVVLFEVLSGRPAVDVRLDEEQHSLAGWARFCVREGEVDRLVDSNLVGQISAACLQVFVGIAGRSIRVKPLERPSMADVVMGLELALALQESICSGQREEEDDDDDDNAGRICSDMSKEVVSMDDISDPKGELDGIISPDYHSSSSRNKVELDE